MSQSPFTLNLDGTIALPDDDGDPAYHLQPEQAFALSQFIDDNRKAIDDLAGQQRIVSAFRILSEFVAAGLPIPSYTRVRWDGRLVVEIDTDVAFSAWDSALDGTNEVDEHPTLGRRASKTSAYFHVEGPWVAERPAEVPA